MRRNYISEEFKYDKVNGTLSMNEKSSFFGSKMMIIDDEIHIDSTNIVYYENNKSEQINIQIEQTYDPLYINMNDIKKGNSYVYMDSNGFSDINNSNWIIEIDYKKILLEYIFGRLKNARTFEGIYVENTLNNSVDLAIRKYIQLNILNRYVYNSVDIYISYNDLNVEGNFKYVNKFNVNINNDLNKCNEIEKKYIDDNIIKLKFKLNKDSSKYSFDYYFDIKYNRI